MENDVRVSLWRLARACANVLRIVGGGRIRGAGGRCTSGWYIEASERLARLLRRSTRPAVFPVSGVECRG